jgi:hypothetical protein
MYVQEAEKEALMSIIYCVASVNLTRWGPRLEQTTLEQTTSSANIFSKTKEWMGKIFEERFTFR